MSLHSNLKPEPIGKALRELRSTDNFFVICVRLWAQENVYGDSALRAPDWRSGFRALGLNAATQQRFDRILDDIFQHSQPSIRVNYYTCSIASRDEHWLLGCLTLAQRAQEFALMNTLRQRLPEERLNTNAQGLKALGQAMAKAGLLLSCTNIATPLRSPDVHRQVGLLSASQTLH